MTISTKTALAAVRVLGATVAEGSLDAREVALEALRDFLAYHTPAVVQPGTDNLNALQGLLRNAQCQTAAVTGIDAGFSGRQAGRRS